MRMLIPISMLLACCVIAGGCSRGAGQSPEQIAVTAEDTQSDVRVTTRIASSEIEIADRIWVTDTSTWESSSPPAFEPRAWDETEWTVIETVTDPIAQREGLYSLERRTLLEPFLPGAYEIPPAVVRLRGGEQDDDPRLLATETIPVSVLGVLPDEDEGELNPIADAMVPDEPAGNDRVYLWLGLGALVIAIAGGLLYAFRTGTSLGPRQSIAGELQSVRDSKGADTAAEYERLARVFDRLDPRLRETSEFSEMIRVCEEARFSTSPQRGAMASPQRIAAHALELLGHDEPSKTGGAIA